MWHSANKLLRLAGGSWMTAVTAIFRAVGAQAVKPQSKAEISENRRYDVYIDLP